MLSVFEKFYIERPHFYQAAVAIKISNLLICFCRFDSSCPILEKDIFIKNEYIVLSRHHK